jgi:serine/threonine-protein kinase PknK
VTATGVVDVPGYQELTQLDRGPLATTYSARREDGHDVVVVKVLHSEFANVPTRRALARYRQDAQRLGGQEHVLHPLDSGTTYTGQLYVVTEYCERGSMLDRAAAEGPLPVEQVLAAAVPVALALGAAHRLGLCHRSVKPSNILLQADGRPVLADFVTAALRADRLMSLAGPAPLHTAPELLSGTEPTPRGDVYSLAATLYHLLAGRAPYPDRGGVAGLLLSMMTDPAPRLTRADAPESLRDALAGAMSTAPEDRFPDALAFAEQLHAVVTGLGGAVPYAWPAAASAVHPPGTAARPTADEAPPRIQLAAAPVPGPPADEATLTPAPTAVTPPRAVATTTDQVMGAPTAPQHHVACPAAEHASDAPARPRPDDTSTADVDTVEIVPRDQEPALLAAGPSAPRRRLRRAGVAGLLVVAALTGGGWLAAARDTGNSPVERPASVSAAPGATAPALGRAGEPTPTHGESQVAVAALAPADVAVTDNGTAIGLRWTLPAGATDASIVVQQQPVAPGKSQLTILEPGTTSHLVTGLDAGTAYCFRVGVLVSVGTAGRPATVAWSEPVGVRGACTVASAAHTPS